MNKTDTRLWSEYLWQSGQKERLTEIMEQAATIVEAQEHHEQRS